MSVGRQRRRAGFRGLLVLGIAAGLALIPRSDVTAASPPNLAQVNQQVTALEVQAETATEAYNAARDDIAGLTIRLTAAQTGLTEERAAVAAARTRLGQIAADTYKDGQLGTLSLFLGDNPDAAVEADGLLVSLGDRRAAAVADLVRQQQLLVGSLTDIQAQQQTLALTEQQLQTSRRQIQVKLDQASALLRRLTSRQRTELNVLQTTTQRAQFLAAGVQVPASGQLTCADVPIGPVDARVAKVLGYACARLGDPYQWAGAGPSRFDCSGLSMMAWAQAGVSLPHNAALQAGLGTRVSLSDLRPGDLVFYFSPISHDGIYLGGGLMVHAPHTGTDVQIAPISSVGTVVAAVRL